MQAIPAQRVRGTGGRTIDYPVDAKTRRDIPVSIREGAIIPTQPVMDYRGQHPAKP